MNITASIKPATGELDEELLQNPDRGFRMEINVYVEELENLAEDPVKQLRHYTDYYAADKPTLAQTYFYLKKFNGTPVIPQGAIDHIQANFDYARQKKISLLVRFTYQDDMGPNAGEAPLDIMLAHMKYLKPLLEKNKDVLHVVQSGFLGAWGEWHSNTLDIDKTALLRGIIEMAPADKQIQMRLPAFKNLIPKTDPAYNRLGFENDSLFGEAAGGTGGVDPGTVPWQQITEESPFLQVDGELFWGKWSFNHDGNDDGRLIDGFKVIKELSEHRFTSMSLHHNYREDDGYDGKYSMQYWKETEITKEWLAENNIIYSQSWFKNGPRSLFDFVRDHLGYKLEAREVSVKTSGGETEVSLSLVNYGFSACYNLKSGFVVLDAGNKVITSAEAGNPSAWHSRNPYDYTDSTLLLHTLTARLPYMEQGQKIAFYLVNPQERYARLSNDIEFVNGYNILCECK